MERAPNSKFGLVVVRLLSKTILLVIVAILSVVFNVELPFVEQALVGVLDAYNFTKNGVNQ